MVVLSLQNVILKMVATDRPLNDTMDRLCHEVEALLPGVICSVVSVDRAGYLHSLSAPSLPQAYSAVLEGVLIGPDVGSCGSCAYFRAPVTVVDIANDAKWAQFRHHILPLGLRACWSSPICDERGDVIGTFAFYYAERRGPTDEEKQVVANCTYLSMIAMERHDRMLERQRMADIDGLTGLSNRSCFNRALAGLSCETLGAWGILILDLDNLKITNDTFGHQSGDDLLREVAARVAATVWPEKAFRVGGDEFAVIIHSPGTVADLETLAQQILSTLSEPALCDGHLIYPQATMGGAALACEDASPKDVRRNADFALYHAKDTGKGGFVLYWPGIQTAITDRLTAISDLAAALRENRVEAYYQPLVCLDTRKIVGVEALCRIITPDGEVIPAAMFGEAMSDAQVAYALTELMVSQIVTDVATWLELDIHLRHIGLNVSAVDVRLGNLSARLAAALTERGVPLEKIVVEITENVYLGRHDHVMAREIKAMRELGVRVALDNFGTGFASLTHLLGLPVDILKIHRSFVANLAPGSPSSVIVEGLLSMAHKLGIEVVAEGVETECQAEQLGRLGCVYGQGHLFSRAVDRETMTGLLLL